MRLHVGQQAPHFEVFDIYGRLVAPTHYRGRKLLLSFYRGAVCPLCMVRLWHLSRRATAYRRWGLEIVAFFESSPAQTRRYLNWMRPPFPVVADLGRRVYMRYGLEA